MRSHIIESTSAPPMHQPPTAEMIGLVVSKPTVGMQRHNSGKSPVSAPPENASLPAPVMHRGLLRLRSARTPETPFAAAAPFPSRSRCGVLGTVDRDQRGAVGVVLDQDLLHGVFPAFILLMTVVPRHRVSPLASPMTGSSGDPVRHGLTIYRSASGILDRPPARAMTAVENALGVTPPLDGSPARRAPPAPSAATSAGCRSACRARCGSRWRSPPCGGTSGTSPTPLTPCGCFGFGTSTMTRVDHRQVRGDRHAVVEEARVIDLAVACCRCIPRSAPSRCPARRRPASGPRHSRDGSRGRRPGPRCSG